MSEYYLSTEEISQLKADHRKCKRLKDGDKIKSIILLGKGWSVAAVADTLLLDAGTIRSYFSQYKKGGVSF